MNIKIATRGSKLALVQTNLIIAALQQQCPELKIEKLEVLTTGDQIQDRSLAELGGKGLFIKGLEERLITGEADIAMHSLKDVPPTLDDDFCIAAVLERQSPHDVLVSEKYANIAALPAGAIVGTSSVRRKAALLQLRSDLEIRMIRGNVDTRLKKLSDGQFDAVILAEAGLKRLGLEQHVKEVLALNSFTPSVGQGIIAIECLQKRHDLIELLQKINHPQTYAIMRAERAMNRALNASCNSPLGSFATISSDKLHLLGVVWSLDGLQRIEAQQSGAIKDAEKIGVLAAEDLIRQGAVKLLGL
ncbi:MAG: hydroxymethylbilane synthase [Gammaproteobacteria bacterium]|jgi:hydroxymethylbilane synthase|nr:hydroxymethylbilane synthase [Gammaproteobacteria bacterium]